MPGTARDVRDFPHARAEFPEASAPTAWQLQLLRRRARTIRGRVRRRTAIDTPLQASRTLGHNLGRSQLLAEKNQSPVQDQENCFERTTLCHVRNIRALTNSLLSQSRSNHLPWRPTNLLEWRQ